MKKRIIVKLERGTVLERHHQSGSWDVSLLVDRTSLRNVMCGFALLLFRKIETLDISSGLELLTVAAGDEESSVSGRKGKFRVLLTDRDIRFVMGYLLEYERDGAASVDHIDIDVKSVTHPADDVVLVIRSADSAPSMSADEAKKQLLG